MTTIEVAEAIVGLLAAAVVLAWIARRLGIPDPVVLVAGGVGLSFLPLGIEIKLDPQIVLLLFVAPLLYIDGYYAPMRELRSNAVSIGMLASVLVIATAGAVAVVAHMVIGMPWEIAFALGAALSATDGLAPVQVLSGAGVDSRLVAVVQGESLLNDGVAFALVGVASAAAVSGSFAAGSAGGTLAVKVGAGVAVGIAVAWAVSHGRRRTGQVVVEAGLSLLTPFLAYVLAEVVHGSGILAAVAAGLWLGRRVHLVEPLTRVELQAAWGIIVFVMNSLLFLLVGLTAQDVVAAVDKPAADVLLAGLAITVTVIGIRMLWAMTIGPAWRGAARAATARVRPASPRAWRFALGWSGVRGSVALAAALSVPTAVADGGALPGRDLMIVLVLYVIVATLLIQGLTLRPLVRRLGLTDPDGPAREEALARRAASQAALDLLEEAAKRHGLEEEERRWLEREHQLRRDQADDNGAEAALAAAERTDLELLDAARAAVLELEDRGEVRTDVARQVIRSLDLDSARLRN